MVQKYFNFNNEADLTPVEVDELSGEVLFSYEGREATFDSLQEFAEFYATARNVLPENLKNWELTEDGESFAFVLKAGTAGITADEIQALVSALNTAGLTPAQIGEAVGAATAQSNPSQSEDVQATDVPSTDDSSTDDSPSFESEIKRVYDKLDPLDKLACQLYFEMDSFGDESKHDNNYIYAYIKQEMENEYNIYNLDDYNDQEDIETAMYMILSEAKDSITNKYPNIPLPVMIKLLTHTYTKQETDEAYENLKKAALAAQLSGRPLPVKVLTDNYQTIYVYVTPENVEQLNVEVLEHEHQFLLL